MRRIIEAHEAASSGGGPPAKEPRARNYDRVVGLVAAGGKKTGGRVSAKRLLPAARAAGYAGSDRNFRRLVAAAKREWRVGQARAGGRRPAVWSPGETLVIDWGEEIVATLGAAHGTEPLIAALERAVAFGRWRAADVRSILATGGHVPRPTAAGQALVLTLPWVPTRSLGRQPTRPVLLRSRSMYCAATVHPS